MGLVIDMTREVHEDGSFTMKPIKGAYSGDDALKRFIAEFHTKDGKPKPIGPLQLDVERYTERDGEDKADKPKVLAGQQGPYIRLVARAFRHREGGRDYNATLMGSVQLTTIRGRKTLSLHPKLQRRSGGQSQTDQAASAGGPSTSGGTANAESLDAHLPF